jgi:hypothetical protein
MVEVMDVLKFRRWEQSKKVNFGRLFAYISEVRAMQRELQCGKVFPSSYLATYSRHKDKNYILVVDMIKQIDSVYGNKPIVFAQLIIGRNQVIVRMMDLNIKDKHVAEIVYDSDSNVLKIAKGILDMFKDYGVLPVKTADYYFGSVIEKYQTSFDENYEMMNEECLAILSDKLKKYGFKLEGTGCVKTMGDFSLTISHKNIYKDYIISLTDNNDRSNIHWAIKDENLDAFMEEIQKAYDEWKETKKG